MGGDPVSMDEKRSTNGGRPPEVSVRRGGQRKNAIGAMTPLAAIAAVAMLWPGGAAAGPQRAEASPSPTTSGREAAVALKGKEGEGTKEGSKGKKGTKEATKGKKGGKGSKGKKGTKGSKGTKEGSKGTKGTKVSQRRAESTKGTTGKKGTKGTTGKKGSKGTKKGGQGKKVPGK